MAYIFLVIFTLAGMAAYDGRRHTLPGRSAAFAALCLLYALVAGLRFRTGIDTVVYEYIYSSVIPAHITYDTFVDIPYEVGFRLTALFFKLFSRSPWPLFLAFALWINISIFLFAWRQREDIGERIFLFAALYLLLAYIPMNFEIIRQSAAVAFLLWAWPSLKSRRYVIYYLWILGAISFHSSAVMLLLLPLLNCRSVRDALCSSRVLIPLGLVMLAGGWLCGRYLFSWLPEQSWVPEGLSFRMREYAGLYGRTGTLNLKGQLGMIVKTAAYPAAAVLLLKRGLSRMERAYVAAGVLITLSGVSFMPALRLIYYFVPLFIAVMVRAVAAARRRYPAWFVAGTFLPLVFLTAYGYCGRHTWYDGADHPSYEFYWPYRNVITGEKDYLRERTMLKLSGMDCEMSQRVISAGPEGYEETADDRK